MIAKLTNLYLYHFATMNAVDAFTQVCQDVAILLGKQDVTMELLKDSEGRDILADVVDAVQPSQDVKQAQVDLAYLAKKMTALQGEIDYMTSEQGKAVFGMVVDQSAMHTATNAGKAVLGSDRKQSGEGGVGRGATNSKWDNGRYVRDGGKTVCKDYSLVIDSPVMTVYDGEGRVVATATFTDRTIRSVGSGLTHKAYRHWLGRSLDDNETLCGDSPPRFWDLPGNPNDK